MEDQILVRLVGTITMRGKPKGDDGAAHVQVSGMSKSGAWNFWVKLNSTLLPGAVVGGRVDCMCEAQVTFEGKIEPKTVLKMTGNGPAAGVAPGRAAA